MASTSTASFQPQDRSEVAHMLSQLEKHRGHSKSGGGNFQCKKATFDVAGSNIKVDSWRMREWDYKKPGLPTYARGLFTTTDSKGNPEIVVRGYDKFFNHGEVRETEWRNVENNTRGPYELSVKENGCIIFMSGLEDGTLLVCSKHSTGIREDIDVSHANVGEKWVERHLSKVGKTKRDLALRLREMNATAVAELCDDAFEEHVLEYTPESAGLYLHGINLNLPRFATYPHHLVDRFADEWGMKKTMYLVKQDIKDVKEFLDSIAETGSYAGRDTEGFVIRCQSKINGEWVDWFFKYKFEEPYLMYRQWRECTKAIIAGKKPQYRKHKKITEEYLLFARKQLHENPNLAKAYQQNHGIIKMRDDFLASRGLKGSDIIRQEQASGEETPDVTRNVVLAPAATIGCGKTTVALALCRLFDWGHVQNDNITVKRGKPLAFVTACTNSLGKYPAVVADRNNHQRRERKQLLDDVSRIVPDARFVCLHYVHSRDSYDGIRRATRERVLARGDNHQTIHTSKGTGEIIGIMEGFMQRFEPVDPEMPPDDGFHYVINLDPCAGSRANLETVVNAMYEEFPKLFHGIEKPSAEDMDAAVQEALNDYSVDLKHEIKSRNDHTKKQQQQNRQKLTLQPRSSPKPSTRKLEYFAVQVPATRINSILDGIFRDIPADRAKMYNMLKQQRRIQYEFHVTLMHRSGANGEHASYWSELTERYEKACAEKGQEAYVTPDVQIGMCNVYLERLVWDQRVMAFTVSLGQTKNDAREWRSVNKVAHITVGTADPSIKPVESNRLLERWAGKDAAEGEGIEELTVKGRIEFDGVVRGVLQKL